MYSDLKRFKIVRRDLIYAVKTARTLDGLLAAIKRKYFELVGDNDPFHVKETTTDNIQQNVNVNIPINSPTTTINGGIHSKEQISAPPPEIYPQHLKCPECGYEGQYYDEIKFCPNCGSSFESDEII
ncbi:MAG: hypothetical protein ACTSQI_22490 [Candidatus Helarchaeota archaeon]